MLEGEQHSAGGVFARRTGGCPRCEGRASFELARWLEHDGDER